jgi:hypothetical protein
MDYIFSGQENFLQFDRDTYTQYYKYGVCL